MHAPTAVKTVLLAVLVACAAPDPLQQTRCVRRCADQAHHPSSTVTSRNSPKPIRAPSPPWQSSRKRNQFSSKARFQR